MNPSRARSRLNAYLEGDLSPRENARLEAALDRSPELRRELRELEETVALLRGLPRPEAPPALADLVMVRVRAGEADPVTLLNWLGRWLEPRYAVPVATAAVALAVFVDSPFEGVPSEAAAPRAQVLAEAPAASSPLRPTVQIAEEMNRMRLETLARRGTRPKVFDILRGSGHPHSPDFASHLEDRRDFSLVSLDAR